MNIFEQASRDKLRFNTEFGSLSAEDLWNIDLNIVDNIAIYHSKKLSSDGPISFINDVSADNKIHQLKFDIAKHIIDVVLQERKDTENAVARKAEKQKILQAISAIETAEFGEKSKEELLEMLEDT